VCVWTKDPLGASVSLGARGRLVTPAVARKGVKAKAIATAAVSAAMMTSARRMVTRS